MKKYLISLFFLFLMGCGQIDRTMEADLTVLTSLDLKEEASGTTVSIPPGEHSVVLRLLSGKEPESPGRVILNVEGRKFIFSLSAKKLSQMVRGGDTSGRVLAQELGQSYDVKWRHTREVTNGPLQRIGYVHCYDPFFPGRLGEEVFPRFTPVYQYKRTIEEQYHMTFLDIDEEVAVLDVALQRVEIIDDRDTMHCF